MHIVKNIERLGLSPDSLATLQHRAEQHLRFSSLDFKVLDVERTGKANIVEMTTESITANEIPGAIVIRIRQGESHAGNHFDAKRLLEITHETFDDLLPEGWKIKIRPIPYRPSPPDIVTPEWLQEQRGQRPTKEIAHDLGMDANMVSGYIGGKRPLSGVVRAMFFWYFEAQKN